MKTGAAYARLVDVFFPATGHKFWAIKPTPFPTLDKAEWQETELMDKDGEALPDEDVLNATTRRMATRIEDQLVEGDADKLVRAAIKDACTYGSGIIKAGTIKIETKKNWVMTPEGWEIQKEDTVIPGIEQPSPFDVYFDTNAGSPESSIGVYHRHVLNKEEVRDLGNFAGFRQSAINELITDYPNGNHNREHHEIERQTLGNITSTGQNTGNYEVLEYWGYIDALDLRNAGVRLRDDQMNQGFQANVWISAHKILRIQIDDGFDKGKKFFVFPYDQIPNQIWGVGVPEIMMDSQDVLNAAFRRLLNDMAKGGSQIEVNVDRLDDRSVNNANEIEPWKIWYRSGGDEAFNAITVHKVPTVGGDLIQIIEMVRRFIDDETNLPSLVSGQAPSTGTEGAETASGLSMLMGAAQIVIKSVVKNVDDFLIKPLIRSYYNFNMEWSDDDDIKGDMKIHALGSSILIAREVQNRNMIEFLALTDNETDAGLIKRPQILRTVARNMGFDEDDAVKSNKELAKEAATPDPEAEKAKAMAFDKAQLENDEIQAKIDVLKSEENKNKAEAAYKEEFLRQRRIKLAEDIKLARIKVKQAQEELKIKASETTPSKTKSAGTGGTKSPKAASDNEPVKILNE
jgi:hypothetical protein